MVCLKPAVVAPVHMKSFAMSHNAPPSSLYITEHAQSQHLNKPRPAIIQAILFACDRRVRQECRCADDIESCQPESPLQELPAISRGCHESEGHNKLAVELVNHP
jgi:hypothetical protein